MSKEEQELEKAKIIFQESKAKLLSSKANSEQLESKTSRFTTVCITSIVGLTAVLSFLKNVLFFKIGILILILGFFYSLFKILQSSKTNNFASDGIEASIVTNDKDCIEKDTTYLLRSLALTYEEKANHNNQTSKQIGRQFDKILKNLEKYLFASSIAMFIGLFIL